MEDVKQTDVELVESTEAQDEPALPAASAEGSSVIECPPPKRARLARCVYWTFAGLNLVPFLAAGNLLFICITAYPKQILAAYFLGMSMCWYILANLGGMLVSNGIFDHRFYSFLYEMGRSIPLRDSILGPTLLVSGLLLPINLVVLAKDRRIPWRLKPSWMIAVIASSFAFVPLPAVIYWFKYRRPQ